MKFKLNNKGSVAVFLFFFGAIVSGLAILLGGVGTLVGGLFKATPQSSAPTLSLLPIILIMLIGLIVLKLIRKVVRY